MGSEYSFSVDDWQSEKWEHVGVDTMYNHYVNSRKTKQEAKNYNVDIDDYAREQSDSHYPMMLYAYPLYSEPSEQEIIDVCTKTNCTVVRNNETDEYCLALSGGGMDLSQDIALAYMLCGERIPSALAYNVCTQPGLSVSIKNYKKIMREIKRTLTNDIWNYRRHIKDINSRLKDLKVKEQAKKQTTQQPQPEQQGDKTQ